MKRFWDKVNKAGIVPEFDSNLGPCWEWTASRMNRGYGHFTVRAGVKVLAHRFSYEMTVGPIPSGLVLDHLCRVRHCVNPDHLRAVTNEENLKAFGSLSPTAVGGANFKQFALITHCPAKHAYTEGNVYLYRGSRHCRACKAARQKIARSAA